MSGIDVFSILINLYYYYYDDYDYYYYYDYGWKL